MKSFGNHFKVLTLVLLAFQLGACAHKKTAPETAQAGSETPMVMDTAISSEPMNFSPQGSDSGKIDGLNSIHFDYDRAVIPASDRALLSQNAAWIKNHPGNVIQIEGHCDARGSVEYNLALGERRAKAVYNSLKGMGVDSSRMTIISFGEERPLVNGDSEAAYAKNRRANFVPLSSPVNQLSSN